MDEITDQFRTEDAEEFKHLQAELEVAGESTVWTIDRVKRIFFFRKKLSDSSIQIA